MNGENEELSQEQSNKLKKLQEIIADFGSLAVGFSGGVDSSLLLKVAKDTLGDRVIAVTSADESMPNRELEESKDFCKNLGVKHILCKSDPLKDESFRKNPPDRCYICKRGIFSEIKRIATENNIEFVAEGSNMDDANDYRPGMKAIEELSIVSPLKMAGLYKSEIRQISKMLGLNTWNKPAYACLASRFVYGEEITREKISMIDRAEQFLIERGFYKERVRIHGDLARIEVMPDDIPRIASDEMRTAIYSEFTKIGFNFVTLDLHGYRMGSMNTTIEKK